MKRVIYVFLVSVLIFAILHYFFGKRDNKTERSLFVAKQIKFDGLGKVIEQLLSNELDYDFFGITSNGVDCIYFVLDDSLLNIDYEIMLESQKQFVEKYKYFAKTNGFEIKTLSYGNKPKYSSVSEAPVYKMIIEGDRSYVERIGIEIQEYVFKNNASTSFDIVP